MKIAMESDRKATDTKRAFIALSTTIAIQALVSMSALTVPVFAPVAAGEMGIAPRYIGLYVAVIYIGSMISSLWSGDFVLRFGAIRVSQVCLGLCGAGLALVATASVPLLVVSALVIGLGYGPITPASSHILAGNIPSHRMALGFSLKQTGVPVGGALAGAVVPSLVLWAGWRHAALIVGALCFALAFLAFPARTRLDEDRQPARRVSLRSFLEPLRILFSHRRILQLAVVSFFFGGMQLCLVTYLVTYLTNAFHMPLISAGLVLSAAHTASVIGRIAWGAIADRYLHPRLVLGFLGLAMSMGSFATALFSPAWPYPAILLVSIGFGATAIGWNGVYLAEVARLSPPGQAGVITGGTLFFTFFGVVMGPPFFGAIVGAAGSYSAGFALFAVFPLICGAVLVFRRNRVSNDESTHKRF